MSLANFHGKSVLAASSLLKKFNAVAFAGKLEAQKIGVVFDAATVRSTDARWTLELLTELIARLYPHIAIISQGSSVADRELERALARSARAINPVIEIADSAEGATLVLVIGASRPSFAVPCIFVGSKGWIVELSTGAPVVPGDGRNPFGAGAAACFAAAAAFRAIFAGELAQGANSESQARVNDSRALTLDDVDVRVSVLTFAQTHVGASHESSKSAGENGQLPDVTDIGTTHLVGLGAIGNGVVWALARASIQGTLHLVDGEPLELSNLQRYALATQDKVGRMKAEIAYEALAGRRVETRSGGAQAGLAVHAHRVRWAQLAAATEGYEFERVLLALDSAEDRIAVQGSLPRWIANAWTQPENLGISRHWFLRDACVMCLYFPEGTRKNKDVLYAEALRALPNELMEVRTLLHTGQPVGEGFVHRFAQRLNVPVEHLARFATEPIERFYTEALCGGIVLQLGGSVGTEANTEVPMAFQSTLAGILLAAELIAEAGSLRAEALPCRTEIDLRKALGTRLNSPAAKHPSGRCICQDPIYIEGYRRKYG